MEYAIPLGLVVLVISALVVLLVMRSMGKSSPQAEEGVAGPGIGADDESPAGDTTQHAGTQDGGQTVGNYDAGTQGGAGRRRGSGYEGSSGVGHDEQDPHEAAHVQRPGEGEGAARI